MHRWWSCYGRSRQVWCGQVRSSYINTLQLGRSGGMPHPPPRKFLIASEIIFGQTTCRLSHVWKSSHCLVPRLSPRSAPPIQEGSGNQTTPCARTKNEATESWAGPGNKAIPLHHTAQVSAFRSFADLASHTFTDEACETTIVRSKEREVVGRKTQKSSFALFGAISQVSRCQVCGWGPCVGVHRATALIGDAK